MLQHKPGGLRQRGDKMFINDAGLRSYQLARITFYHESSHYYDNLFGLPRNEPKAYRFESKSYNIYHPSRYIDSQSGVRPNGFNYLFNIIR